VEAGNVADGFEPTAIVPGMVLADRYRIEQLLGRGQIADVYRGLDQLLARSIAVKVFRQGVVDAAAVARQRTEMQILANLHHPSLVAVYDAKFGSDTIPVPGAAGQGTGTSAGLTYLVMELVDGGTIADRIASGGLSQLEVTRVGIAVAGGLAAVHQFGLVHRDVRPANILLTAGGEVKLSDFGFATEMEAGRLTRGPDNADGAAYLSPEQARGAVIGPASDVYALGLVLLECLTGRREYPGYGVESAVARLTRPPVVPENLPGSWQTVLRAMTQLDPARRPTAAQVHATLNGAPAAVQPTRPAAPVPAPVYVPPPPAHQDKPGSGFGHILGVVLLVLLLAAGLIIGTTAVIRNNPGGTTVNISRTIAPTSVVTTTERTTDVTTERTTETSREVIAPTIPTLAPPTIPTREPNTPATSPAANDQATETVATT